MTTVFVWNNNRYSSQFAKRVHYAPNAHVVVGHVSVNIDDSFTTLLDHTARDYSVYADNRESHVSWWPGEAVWTGERRGFNRLTNSNTYFGGALRSIFVDLAMEGYAPDHVIRIPNPPEASLLRMREAWRTHYGNPSSRTAERVFNFNFNSCARIAFHVLRAGWGPGRGNIRFGQLGATLWNPLMVKRMALSLDGATPMTWDAFIGELADGQHIGTRMESLLRNYQRRASNRGSSEASPRFVIEGSWKCMLGKGWSLSMRGKNPPPTAFVLADLLDHIEDPEVARSALQVWCVDRDLVESAEEAQQHFQNLMQTLRTLEVSPARRIASRRGLMGKR